MAIATATQALNNARATKTNPPGSCQHTTRDYYRAPSAGDRDGDGDADANDGWLSEPASARVPGDRNPPPGAPLYFRNADGTGFGHRAISEVGHEELISTDMLNGHYAPGHTSKATISQVEHSMGLIYVGWCRTITGIPIPGLEKKSPAKPAPAAKPKPRAGYATVDVVVATNNVMSLPKNPDIVKTLKASTTTPTVVGLQELDPVSFKHAADGIGGWDLVKIPDSVNYAEAVMFDETVWTLVRRHFVQQYDGAKGISYTRHFCVTRLRHKALGFEAGFISFHAVTAGNDKQRVFMRRAGLGRLRAVIKAYRKAGVPLFVMGDYNTRVSQHPTATLKLKHGIDHIYFWNGSRVTGTKRAGRAVPTRSDHDVFIARITLTVKKES